MSFIPITRSIGAVTAPGQFNNPNPGYDGVEMAAIEAISASNRFLGLFASNFYDNVPDPLDVTRVLASASYATWGAITAFANDGGAHVGYVKVTAVGHGLLDGAAILIRQTTHYDGSYTVAYRDADHFDILVAWVSNDAAGCWVAVASKIWDCVVSNFDANNKYRHAVERMLTNGVCLPGNTITSDVTWNADGTIQLTSAERVT